MTVKELRRINADEQMRAILEQRDTEEHDRITELSLAEINRLQEPLPRQ